MNKRLNLAATRSLVALALACLSIGAAGAQQPAGGHTPAGAKAAKISTGADGLWLSAGASYDGDPIIFKSDDTICGIGPEGRLHLLKGTVLIESPKQTEVIVRVGAVTLADGAIAVIKVNRGRVRIANLTDFHRHSVTATFAGRALTIEAGKEALFTTRLPGPATICEQPEIGRRSVTTYQLGTLAWVTFSDVCLTDYLKYEPVLKALSQPDGGSHKRCAFAQIIKTAAALNVVLRSKGNYQRWKPATVLAQASPPDRSDLLRP